MGVTERQSRSGSKAPASQPGAVADTGPSNRASAESGGGSSSLASEKQAMANPGLASTTGQQPRGDSLASEKQAMANPGRTTSTGGGSNSLASEKQAMATSTSTSRSSSPPEEMKEEEEEPTTTNAAAGTTSSSSGGAGGGTGGATTTNGAGEEVAEITTAQLVDEEALEKQYAEKYQNDAKQELLSNAVVASEVKPEDEPVPLTFCQKYNTMICCCFILIVIIVVSITLAGRNNNDDKDPIIIIETKPILTGEEYLMKLLTTPSGGGSDGTTTSSSSITTMEKLMDTTTIQYKAFQYLVKNDPTTQTNTSSQLYYLTEDAPLNTTALQHRYVMILLYMTWNGDYWYTPLHFLSNTSVCEWPPILGDDEDDAVNGIRCNSQGDIVRLNLDFNNCTGTIPSELATITSLERISITGNTLYSTIPTELGNLPRLSWLNIGLNYINGTIPETFGNLTNLNDLAIYGNEVTGTIPSSIIKLGQLRRFFCFDNILTGPIPDVFPSRAAMTDIVCMRNQLSGTVPTSFYQLGAMKQALLGYNRLTGSIPSTIGELQQLTYLQLAGNLLTGTVPTEFGTLPNLYDLFLEFNTFTGPIPTEFGTMIQLEIMDVSVNFLTGTIPTELGTIFNLFRLALYANLLTGTVPTELGALEGLRYGFIGLDNNTITGSVSDTFCNRTIYPNFPRPGVLTGDCDEFDCPCCTDCCDDTTGQCVIRVGVFCENKADEFEQTMNPSYASDCSCLDGGFTMTCAAECGPCNNDGSVCMENFDFGLDLGADALDNLVRCQMRYLSGPNANAEVQVKTNVDDFTCTIDVDGVDCNSCDYTICNDGFEGIRADCGNIEVGAVYDDCDPSLTGGNLLQFLGPEFMGSDCPPCLFWL